MGSETPIYTSWMPHPDELPQKPKSRYQAVSTKSDQTLSNINVPFINVEGIEGNRYTSIDIDTSPRNSQSRSAVALKILEYSGEMSSLRDYLYSDEYLLDGELDISELDSYREYSLFVVGKAQESDGGIYLGEEELIYYEGLDERVQSNLFAETTIDLREKEASSYYQRSQSFRNLVESAGNGDLNSVVPIPGSDVHELGIESYALSHDYVSINENSGDFRVGILPDEPLSGEPVLGKKKLKKMVTEASPLLGNIGIRQPTTSKDGDYLVATGEVGAAARAEVLANVNEESKKVRFTVVSLRNSDYIVVEGGKGATVDGTDVNEGEHVYLDTVGSQVTFDFSGGSGQLTAKAVIGSKPSGVNNKDVTDADIQGSSIETPIKNIEYDFSN